MALTIRYVEADAEAADDVIAIFEAGYDATADTPRVRREMSEVPRYHASSDLHRHGFYGTIPTGWYYVLRVQRQYVVVRGQRGFWTRVPVVTFDTLESAIAAVQLGLELPCEK